MPPVVEKGGEPANIAVAECAIADGEFVAAAAILGAVSVSQNAQGFAVG